MMTSKEMEARSGVARANIRYYEAEGLLHPNRAENGYRDYSEADLVVLEKIKLLRRLGVTIEELKALTSGGAALSAVLDRRLADELAESAPPHAVQDRPRERRVDENRRRTAGEAQRVLRIRPVHRHRLRQRAVRHRRHRGRHADKPDAAA